MCVQADCVVYAKDRPVRPLVLLVIDGLRRDVAERHLTALFEIVRAGRGGYLPMTSLMPTNSRPSYNTISTGIPCPQNGIVDNHDNRLVSTPSIWTIARAHGLVTAASAFHWWSELYHHAPFRKDQDTLIADGDGGFQFGFFYQRDGEIDPVVFAHALRLWDAHRPDLLLIHPSSVDWTGDYWGAADPAYRVSASALNLLLPALLEGPRRSYWSPPITACPTRAGTAGTRRNCARSSSSPSATDSACTASPMPRPWTSRPPCWHCWSCRCRRR
jgi:hypothetical protein